MEAAVSAAFTAVRTDIPSWVAWDLENLSRPQAQAYFKTYYAPNNALAVLVGDLDPAEVIRLAERYFGDLPPQPIPPAPILEEPPQTGERVCASSFPPSRKYSCSIKRHRSVTRILSLAVLATLLATAGRLASTSVWWRKATRDQHLRGPGCSSTPGNSRSRPRRGAHTPEQWKRPSRTRSRAEGGAGQSAGDAESPEPDRGRDRGEPGLQRGLASRLGGAWP